MQLLDLYVERRHFCLKTPTSWNLHAASATPALTTRTGRRTLSFIVCFGLGGGRYGDVENCTLQKETAKDERKCSNLYLRQALKSVLHRGILHRNFPPSFLFELWLHELAQQKPASEQLSPSSSLTLLQLPPSISPSRVNNPALGG